MIKCIRLSGSESGVEISLDLELQEEAAGFAGREKEIAHKFRP